MDTIKYETLAVRATSLHVKKSDAIRVVFSTNHGAYDALALRLVFDDLDKALDDPSQVEDHVPYKFLV